MTGPTPGIIRSLRAWLQAATRRRMLRYVTIARVEGGGLYLLASAVVSIANSLIETNTVSGGAAWGGIYNAGTLALEGKCDFVAMCDRGAVEYVPGQKTPFLWLPLVVCEPVSGHRGCSVAQT